LAMFKTFSVSMSLKFDSVSKKTFYRAMHVELAPRGIAIVSRPSVCP